MDYWQCNDPYLGDSPIGFVGQLDIENYTFRYVPYNVMKNILIWDDPS